MKILAISIIAMATFFIFIPAVSAGLLDRGNGLIYDDELNITWMQTADD